MSWRMHTLEMVDDFCKRNNLKHLQSIYMFGVYTGESVIDSIKIFGLDKQYYLCDSFEGLPEEKNEKVAQECWKQGEFNATKKLGCSSIEETISTLEQLIVNETKIKKDKLTWVKGFYSESLPKLIEEKVLGPALYVDIDCDLYSSTIDALDFMFSNKLIRPGTILGYDDWGGTPGWFVNVDGESRAHIEICKKYNVQCKKVFQAGNRFPHVHTMFIVTDVK